MPREGHEDEHKAAVGDTKANGQHEDYWVLSAEETSKGYTRPYRTSYVHSICGTKTTMSGKISATYARNPKFYGRTFCCGCGLHFPVAEFLWDGTEESVGS